MTLTELEHKIAYSFSGKNRRKKFDYFMQVFQPDETTRILDVGASEQEFSPTDNLLEKLYPYQNNLTVLGVDPFDQFCQRYPEAEVHVYDGRVFPFADNSFDICWSNAVIEHVGDRQRQLLFLQEIKRVARNAFITTPNKYFPVEVHTRTPFLHFLPKRVFDGYLRFVGKSWAAGDYMHLLSFSEIKRLLAESGIEHYHVQKNRMFGFTLDYMILFGERFEPTQSGEERLRENSPPGKASIQVMN